MAPQFKVAILGSGFGGLGMAIQLKRRGEDGFVVLEKGASAGGTWRENTYPGSGCDVPSHLYSYSFEQNPSWTRVFSLQKEIMDYLDRMIAKYELAPKIRYNAEVTDAAWDEAAGFWRIRTRDGQEVTAQAFVAAWGQLNRPAFSTIAGRDDFTGAQFHSAHWNHDVSLDGKRVAIIGNGATAVQIVPEIAPKVSKLEIFQRSANWIVPRLDRAYADWERKMYAAAPWLLQANRSFIYWMMEMRFAAFKQGTKFSETFKGQALKFLEDQIQDPELRKKLTPDYSIGCKRVLVSDDFYAALTRDNVDVVTTPIERIEAMGIRTKDGTLHEADVLVHATGFETHSFMGAEKIVGRNGVSLAQAWKDVPQAYLGITVSGFPNFFVLYGPNTNLGHNSIIFMLECQINYALQALDALAGRKAKAVDVKSDVMARFNAQLQEELKGTAWAGGCESWYKTADGKITNNWSGPTTEYKKRTAKFAEDDYAFS